MNRFSATETVAEKTAAATAVPRPRRGRVPAPAPTRVPPKKKIDFFARQTKNPKIAKFHIEIEVFRNIW